MMASALEVLTIPLAQRLINQYPDIRLNIESGLAGNIQQGFEAGQYDLVLSHLVEANEGLNVENLIEEDLFLVTAYNPNNTGADIEFAELDNMPLIIPQEQHGVAPDIDKYAQEKNIQPATAQVTGALRSTIQLIEVGVGNSILPWSAINRQVNNNAISARKIINPSLHHTVSMIYPTHRPLTPATIAVMELIRDSARSVHQKGKWSGALLLPKSP